MAFSHGLTQEGVRGFQLVADIWRDSGFILSSRMEFQFSASQADLDQCYYDPSLDTWSLISGEILGRIGRCGRIMFLTGVRLSSKCLSGRHLGN